MSFSGGDHNAQVSALRLELANAKCRNEELERHLHLSKKEVSFLRSEVLSDSSATRDQQLVLLSSHSGSSRDMGRTLAMEQECAMLRSLLGETQRKLHLANKECAYLKGELEGTDGGCNERLVVWKDVRNTSIPLRDTTTTTSTSKTSATNTPPIPINNTVEASSNTEGDPLVWERDLLEVRAQLEALQRQHPPTSITSCGTQVLRCRTAHISTQTTLAPSPLTQLVSLAVEDPQEEMAPPPYSPKRAIPVHDPNDPKHRAECVWCSGRTIQLSGGTFGVSSPQGNGSWRRSVSAERRSPSAERRPIASRDRPVTPNARSPHTSFREVPRVMEEDTPSPSRLRSALLMKRHS